MIDQKCSDSILLSIIVPVYNVEKYIHRFFQSVCPYMTEAVEMIVIDDGSTDDCPAIIDSYASEYHHLRVIHQKNKGVSAARNVGLDLCRGEMITFLDPDDCVTLDYVENVLRYAESRHTTAFSLWMVIDDENAEKRYDYILQDSGADCPVKDAVTSMEKSGTLNYVYNKLYVRAVVEKTPAIRFPVSFMQGEDLLFNCEYFSRIQNAETVSTQLYYYYRQEALENTLSHKQDPELWEKTKVYISSRGNMYQALGLTDDESRNMLYKQNLYCVIKCVPNMYRKNRVLPRKDRLVCYRDILKSPAVKAMVDQLRGGEREMRVFQRIYSLRSAVLMDALFYCYFNLKYARIR